MELFTSSNKSQWAIIKRWIDESDIYMLILGGRYGSIEAETGKSYTHLEYEYAQSINKPLFAVVINDDALRKKTYEQHEIDNPQKLSDFRQQVLNYLSAFFSDSKDIKLAVHESLGTLIQDNELVGWIRGSQQNEGLASELVRLNEENRKLREENEEFKRNQQVRSPKLAIEINDGKSLILQYQEYKAYYYKNRKPIVWSEIKDELKEFLTAEEIELYNQQLLQITEEKIQEFNRWKNLSAILENNAQPIKLRVFNKGNLKATQVYITIKFPEFFYVQEKNEDDKKIDLIKKLEKSALAIIPKPLWNPLNQAKEKLKRKQLKEQSILKRFNALDNNLLFPNHENLASAVMPESFGRITIPKSANIRGDDDYLDNSGSIVIKMGNLLHTLGKNYEDYYIYPLTKGKGKILVNLHCEEYANEETVEIPIIVE